MHGDVLGPVDEIGKVADPIPRQIPCGQIPCGRERCLSGLSPVCFCASGGRDEGSTALWDNYICAIAQRGTLTSRDFDKLVPNSFVGWLPIEKLVGGVGPGALPVAVDFSLRITV